MHARPLAVLLIGGGHLQKYMIPEAHALGLKVVCTDANPQAPGCNTADRVFLVDTYDAEATAALVPTIQKDYTLCGVVTCGGDTAPTVALAAQVAGTPGIPYAVAQATHNKWMVRHALHNAELDAFQPRYAWCASSAADIYTPGYPCVVKPLSQRASRGVTIIHTDDQLSAAINNVRNYGPHFLIEQYLTGTEHSAEIILNADGIPLFFNIVDRFFDYSSGVPIELGHINPTHLSPGMQLRIYTLLRQAAGALGITWGPFKADLLITQGQVRENIYAPMDLYILECTARLSGGYDSQWTCPHTKRYPMRLLLQLACDLPLEPQKKIREAHGYAAAPAILPQRTGQVTHLPWSESRPGVWTAWHIKYGERIHPAQHNGERAGFVLRWGKTYEDTWRRAREEAERLAAAIEISED